MRIEERIKNVISNVFGIEQHLVSENSSPDTIESWTSLGHMNLVVALEEEFKVQFNDMQIIEMMNYSLIVCIVKEVVPEVDFVK